VKKGRVSVLRICFYNIPARRNFLKSNGVEMSHITEEFQRIALANPSISFSLIQEDELVLDMPAAKLSQRIVISSEKLSDSACSCSGRTSLLRITGYIGRPELAKRNVVNNSFS